jgi:hypothetical protein
LMLAGGADDEKSMNPGGDCREEAHNRKRYGDESF